MMKMLKSLLLCLSLSFLAPAAMAAGKDYMTTYTVKGDFDEVRDNIVFAINGRGMVINTVSHIGEMLARTGQDLGTGKQIFLKAEGLEFCSATVSRAMMEADPHNIVFCPYIIMVYVLPNDPKTVHVSFRKPDLVGDKASRKSLKAVEDLLNSIIKEATQ